MKINDFYKIALPLVGLLTIQSANALDLMPEISDLTPEFSDFYVGVDAAYIDVDISGENAHPYMITSKAGLTIKPQVIIEVQYSVNASDDSILQSDVEVENTAGIYLRLESQEVNNVTADLMLGYATTDLALSGRQDLSGSFSDIVYGLGLNQRYRSQPHVIYRMDYKVLYNDDDIRISAFSLGVKYSF